MHFIMDYEEHSRCSGVEDEEEGSAPQQPQRPPSPIRPSPNKQTLTYAQAQRMVDMEIDGRVHRISIYDKLDVISDDDPMAQEIMECVTGLYW
ncbi:unnamed protein product [Oncorhynchus mykiss]|uniref:Uncharacterized protein n=1 Tax=Oncorhynchus mykiss TaxID=8022 RepID=A0A060XF98_ONCMY|nr:unnamed protein product [Oncorhynchus mykiss]